MTSPTIVMREAQSEELRQYLFDEPGNEGAAFLLCGQSAGATSKLIVHSVSPLRAGEYGARSHEGVVVTSQGLTRVAKLARLARQSVIFAHSHPSGPPMFSPQDDREEDRLIPFLQSRIETRIHGTLVVSPEGTAGRIYNPSRQPARVAILGHRFQFHSPDTPPPPDEAFARQVQAFGPTVQQQLGGLTAGIVGVGGTGSATAELLCRLGVGSVKLFDGDRLERTNVSRLLGSSTAQVGQYKVDILRLHLERMKLGTIVETVPEDITELSSARKLRDCDIAFGCTDKQLPRAILGQLSLRYLIPVFDLGVVLDSLEGHLRGVYGRVTTLLPGEACLHCRGRINSQMLAAEALSGEERSRRVEEGYAPELPGTEPAVVSYTVGTAGFATSELINRLTGFMGTDRWSTEVLIEYDQLRIRTNRVEPRPYCACGTPAHWGIGDETPFLGLTWLGTHDDSAVAKPEM